MQDLAGRRALPVMIARWLSDVQSALVADGYAYGSEDFSEEMSRRILTTSRELQGYVGGFDFSAVIMTYYRAVQNGDDDMQSRCMKWLRGEYRTKTEAKREAAGRRYHRRR